MPGLEIKLARLRHGLRQYRVAAALGVPQTTLCAIENGKKLVSPERAEEIKQAIQRLAAEVTTNVSAA
jgi:transcriptional regulator with XRE-family HTH domain